MSYILDALKKSDRERQQQAASEQTPSLPEPVLPATGNKNRHYVLLGIVLLTTSCLAWWIGGYHKENGIPGRQEAARREYSQESSVAPEKMPSETVSQEARPPSAPVAVLPLPEGKNPPPSLGQKLPDLSPAVNQIPAGAIPLPAEEEPDDQDVQEESGVEPVETPPEEETFADESENSLPGLAEIPAAQPVPQAVPQPHREQIREQPGTESPADSLSSRRPLPTRLPDFTQLDPAIKQRLPSLSLSLHLYVRNPVRRKVAINGLIIKQGDTVDGDLKLEEITPDGAILSFEGTRFHLSVFQ